MSVPSWAEPYIDRINGSGFWWKDYENNNYDTSKPFALNYYPCDTTSWFTRNNFPFSYSSDYIYCFTTNIKTVNITENNGTYSYSITFDDGILPNFYESPSSLYTAGFIKDGRFGYSGNSYTNPISCSRSTIESCLDDLSHRARNVDIYVNGECWSRVSPVQTNTSNGGGATHIAKVTGQLSSLSNNLSDILIVSGGGGGGMLIGETEYTGADAGGIAGNGTNSADQTTGYAFGQGESSSNASGGGGGLYGGYKGVIRE